MKQFNFYQEGREMVQNMNRRSFLKSSVAGAVAGVALGNTLFNNKEGWIGTASAEEFRGKIRRAVYFGMLPQPLSVMDKFKLAKECGFDGVEVPTLEEPAQVEEFKKAMQATGVIIHSVMNQRHWKFPLSSADTTVVKKSIEGMEISLRNAKEFGAETVLLVPAVVNADISYKDAYVRSQKYIRELLPLAKELNIIIAVENVWNKFLLSPLEFARYVDEFDHPCLKAYFDVGNIVLYGIPQDWIRTLGKRIVKVHVKGFDEKNKQFVNLRDGTIDWLGVRRAFSDIGYSGYITAELSSGDAAYLKDVCDQMGKIITGEKLKS